MQRAKQQMTVLRAPGEADGPQSAREQWSRLSGTGVGLATVYRALQRGVEEGRLESVEGLGGGVRYEPRDREHHHHFLCSACDQVHGRGDEHHHEHRHEHDHMLVFV